MLKSMQFVGSRLTVSVKTRNVLETANKSLSNPQQDNLGEGLYSQFLQPLSKPTIFPDVRKLE